MKVLRSIFPAEFVLPCHDSSACGHDLGPTVGGCDWSRCRGVPEADHDLNPANDLVAKFKPARRIIPMTLIPGPAQHCRRGTVPVARVPVRVGAHTVPWRSSTSTPTAFWNLPTTRAATPTATCSPENADDEGCGYDCNCDPINADVVGYARGNYLGCPGVGCSAHAPSSV
ncbi:hypothetical protein JG688_00011444 [Phytophthora aleatoria]|uniref:Uncharacterized protein n=1 Tax=Phytophthora aleatoria TaxID=2496075 RepID=A0A8J5IK18_9STRA|nr:hypothetical protein JG688_00011444 [Phytophthora aleatoria]